MTDAIDNAIDDMLLARAAGYYATATVDPDEDMPTITGQHPISKLMRAEEQAAHPHAAEARAEAAEQKLRDMALQHGDPDAVVAELDALRAEVRELRAFKQAMEQAPEETIRLGPDTSCPTS